MKIYYSTKFSCPDKKGKQVGRYMLPVKCRDNDDWFVGVLLYREIGSETDETVIDINREFILHEHFAILGVAKPEFESIKTIDECLRILDEHDLGNGKPFKDCAVNLGIELSCEDIQEIIRRQDLNDPDKFNNTILFT